MVKLSKKVEYALIALKHIKSSDELVVTAKEISSEHGIPYELLAKILQKLKKENILISSQGIKGGYKLNISLDNFSLSNLIDVLDEATAIVECQQLNTPDECILFENCDMKTPMGKMQRELMNLFKSKMVSDFI